MKKTTGVVRQLANLRTITLPDTVLFAFAWAIFAFNYSNPDFYQYESIYDLGAIGVNGRIEFGFLLLVRLANICGLSFMQFRAVIALIGITVLFSCIRQYVANPAIVYLAYILYPFLFDLIQLRMFIVMVIVVFATRYLVNFSPGNLTKYVICILTATSFHSTAIFFIILVCTYIESERCVFCISIITALAELLLFNQFVVTRLIKLFSFVSANLASGSRYVTFAKPFERLMWLYFAIVFLTIVVVLVMREKEATDINDYESVLVKILYISIVAVPLMKLGSSFGRFFRVLLPLVYCAIASSGVVKEGLVSRKNCIKLTYLVLLALLLFYAHIYTGSNDTYNRVLMAVIKNNYVFELFN